LAHHPVLPGEANAKKEGSGVLFNGNSFPLCFRKKRFSYDISDILCFAPLVKQNLGKKAYVK